MVERVFHSTPVRTECGRQRNAKIARFGCGLAIVALLATGAQAAPPAPPAAHPAAHTLDRDNPERHQMMDALRPLVEPDFGKPIEFAVTTRLISPSGRYAWLSANAQHKGGAKLHWTETPLIKNLHETGEDLDNSISVLGNCCDVTAVFEKRADGLWHVLKQVHASSDDDWFDSEYCKNPEIGPMIGKMCKPSPG